MFIYSTDLQYLPVTCVSIASLAATAAVPPTVLLLVHDVGEDDVKQAVSYLDSCEVNVVVRRIDPEPFSHVCRMRGQSPAKFAPLLWQTYVPDIPEKVVCIDADTQVLADAGRLLARDLNGHSVAAVHDSAVISDNRSTSLCEKLSIAPEAGYFNSGVLVIDPDKWLTGDLGKKALQVLNSEQHLLTWNDQCALNKVVAGDWEALPFAWNKLAGSAPVNWPAAILHFAGTYKPWKVGYLDRFRFVNSLVGHHHKQQFADLAGRLEWPEYCSPRLKLRNSRRTLETIWKQKQNGQLQRHQARRHSPSLAAFVEQRPQLLAPD